MSTRADALKGIFSEEEQFIIWAALNAYRTQEDEDTGDAEVDAKAEADFERRDALRIALVEEFE